MGPSPRTPTSHHRMWRRFIPPGRLVRFVRLVGCSRKPDAAIGRDEAVDACAGGGATCAVSKLSGFATRKKNTANEKHSERFSAEELRQAAAGTPHSMRSTVTIDLHLTLTPTKTPTDTHRANREPTPITHTSTRPSPFPPLEASDAPELRFRKPRSHRQATGDRRQATGRPGGLTPARVLGRLGRKLPISNRSVINGGPGNRKRARPRSMAALRRCSALGFWIKFT